MSEDHNREKSIFSGTVVVADDEQVDSSMESHRGCRDGLDAVVGKAIHDGRSIGHGAAAEDQSIASSGSSGMEVKLEEEEMEFSAERNQNVQDNATDTSMDNTIGKVSAASADTVRDHEYPSSESTIGKEPTVSVDTLHGLEHPGVESCGTAIVAGDGQAEPGYIESPIEQVLDPPDATAGTELTASAVIMQDQQHPIPEKIIVPGIEAGPKPRKYVLTTTGDDLFQPMNATDKTPPTSPGGESTCSTLVDPSSRKVSPSDSTMGAEASPTAVKDFAYPSWDSNHVRDPASIVEENMKLELARQLRRKKIALEWKDHREAEKKKGRNQTLCAEVEEARRTLLNREVRADLAKVHANALILSNVVLRQYMQDVKHGLSHGQHGAKVQMSRSAGQKFENQEKEGSLKNHLGCAGTFAASAYACTQRLKCATETSGEGLDDLGSQGCMQQEEIVESKQSSPIEALDRQISEELQSGCVASKDSANASGGTQLEPNAEDSLGRLKGKVDDDLFEKPVLDAAMLLDTSNSLGPAVSEAIDDVKGRGVTVFTDETGIAIFQDSQHTAYKDPSPDNETKFSKNSKVQIDNLPIQTDRTHEGQIFSDYSIPIESTKSFDMANPGNKTSQEPTLEKPSPSEFGGRDDVFEANNDNSPPAVADPQSGTDIEHNDTQGTCIGHEGGSNGNFDFSKAAGSATLWGILQSNWCEIKAQSQAYTVEEATSLCDAAGPATLWGILRSDQSEHEAEDTRVVEEEVAGVSAVPGPATLWGILESDAHESEAGEQEDADDAAAEIPEVEISEPATESGEATTPQLWVDDLSAIEEDGEEDGEEPCGPNNTPIATNGPHGFSAANPSADDATGAGWAAHAKGSEASPKVSKIIYDDEGAKSGDSDAVTRAGPSMSAIPAEKECPEELEVGRVQAPSDFGDLYTSHDDFRAGAKGADHKTSNVAIVDSSNTLAQTGDVSSGGDQALSLNASDISLPRALLQPEAQVSKSMPPMSQPNEMSKTQKRKLERKRAAAKKAEAKELLRKKEEEAAESMRRKEDEKDEAGRAPFSLAQRLAEEDSKLGEKRRMLQLARMAEREEFLAEIKSLGKSAGR